MFFNLMLCKIIKLNFKKWIQAQTHIGSYLNFNLFSIFALSLQIYNNKIKSQ